MDTEPRQWGIMSHDSGYRSHDGGVSLAMKVDTELRRWGIMSHNGGYRAMMVEYHESRGWILSHDGGVS